MYSYFTHPNSVHMTYFEHLITSLTYAVKLFLASLKAVVHAFIPSFYITSTHDIVNEINRDIKSVLDAIN